MSETTAECSCSECGSDDIRFAEYDFGMDRETGYRDAGMRGRCRNCGLDADECDFVRKVAK